MMIRAIACWGYPLSLAWAALISRPVRSSRQYMQGQAPLVWLIQPLSHVVCSQRQPGRAQWLSYKPYMIGSCCFMLSPSVCLGGLGLGLGPDPASVVVGFWYYLPYPRGRRVALSYPRPVLFPPSFRSSGYPLEIRAHGHDALLLCLWWRL